VNQAGRAPGGFDCPDQQVSRQQNERARQGPSRGVVYKGTFPINGEAGFDSSFRGYPGSVCTEPGVQSDPRIQHRERSFFFAVERASSGLGSDGTRRGAVLRSGLAVWATTGARGGGDLGDRILDPTLGHPRISTGREGLYERRKLGVEARFSCLPRPLCF